MGTAPEIRAPWTRVLLTGLLLAACVEPSGPTNRFRIEVRSGGGGIDTVLATATEPLNLRILDANRHAAVGVQVQVRALPPATDSLAAFRSMYVCRIGTPQCAVVTPNGYFVIWGVRDTTDAAGEVHLQVQHGVIAAPGGLEITVEDDPVPDTLAFATLPGNVARIALAARDTAVYPGRSFALGAHAADRFLNQRPDPVGSASLDPSVASVAGDIVTAIAIGRGRILLSAGNVLDTARVSVPPPGRLVTIDGVRLTLVNTDGSDRRLVLKTPGSDVMTPVWTPDGSHILFPERWGGISEIHLILADTIGSHRVFLSDTSLFGNTFEAATSADAVYFYGTGGLAGVFRAELDGSGGVELFPGVQPAPAPDGSQIAYIDDLTLLVRATSSGATSSLAMYAQFPRWAPLGDQIAYLEVPSGFIHLINADGTNPRVLAGPYMYPISWSPDAQWIVAAGSTGLSIVRVADGEALPIPGTRGLNAPAWRP